MTAHAHAAPPLTNAPARIQLAKIRNSQVWCSYSIRCGACSHSRRMFQVENMSYDGTKCATRKHIQIGRSVCLCFSLSISVSFLQIFIARREGGEEVVLSLYRIGFVDHSFPSSPTCLTCVSCLLYLCRARFAVVAPGTPFPLPFLRWFSTSVMAQ